MTNTQDDAEKLKNYLPKNKLRFITAAALFDGHDASINIMRRLIQARGGEVIHLGHNRSAAEVVSAALQEDVQGIAISSYQGGHVEYFKYLRKLLDENAGEAIKIFGGGGGVIVPKEVEDIESSGVSKIYTPADGQRLGLAGIIGHLVHTSDFTYKDAIESKNWQRKLAREITLIENEIEITKHGAKSDKPIVLGITGTGGAGKSSLTDEIINRFVYDHPECKIGVLCIDPSKKKTGGALLGDRIRMNVAENSDQVFIRSIATRGSGKEISSKCKSIIEQMQQYPFDFIICETSGIGQGDSSILELSDISLYVMTAEYGASTQLEKIDMLDFADFVAINKFERSRSLDAYKDVKNVLRRSRFSGKHMDHDAYPIYGTIASRFNDDGANGLYKALAEKINSVSKKELFKPSTSRIYAKQSSHRDALIPGSRINYLSEISNTVRNYHQKVEENANVAKHIDAIETLKNSDLQKNISEQAKGLSTDDLYEQLDPQTSLALKEWDETKSKYSSDIYSYQVRKREIQIPARFTTLSQLKLAKVSTPDLRGLEDRCAFIMKENLPGRFPFTAGVYPFRRTNEDPKRQFAGEGGPTRTNKRFHFLTKKDPAKRLSTAFDSVTLYGADPHERPDIYGKVGESGVSIATLDDMKELYKGFDLCDPSTSVSMTINGPAPIILAMFLNTALDQQVDFFVEKNKRQPNPEEFSKISSDTLQAVRGTVQADILKEDQAQNTCIFSTEFALKLMGDMQAYFIDNSVRNYYSVSISGYHIAEAGANPITQLAFTLANGFTYVEYYLARGMKIDDFVPNLSFFFSNGLDAEYAVLGRVARRIWAIAMRDIYNASERAQKLKYHIQTSGRSLHAQEMAFNDIRTTLQALIALYDNCNSLHTNAFDEAVTTPTENSVRQAMAIQMVINHEFGPNQCENINQGSYFLESLTDLVEEAVLKEFDKISIRGGVLGAMESQYQRTQIQEESLYYETLKDSGDLKIIGVNYYRNPNEEDMREELENVQLIRASYDEKNDQIKRLTNFITRSKDKKQLALAALEKAVLDNDNIFAELMNAVRHVSLGEITSALYKLGGKYRRNM